MPDTRITAIETRNSTGEKCAADFVYTIFIKATAEQVWNGLIERELTKSYWGHYNESDWKPGSRWEHVRSDGSGKIDIRGRIIEMTPPHKMVWSWGSDENADQPEKLSRVTYELVNLGPDTKLTVIHSELEPESAMNVDIRNGWPMVLSNLKSFLETGKTLAKKA
ncbi:SRPBCC family protein [uncultured Parasphingorhabdus sp.]|uniref:SRPBCC family protein n=1 Tax=uncultured Parasphingorhabdus sp. TaxID=2709694 RepID=UPI0030D75834